MQGSPGWGKGGSPIKKSSDKTFSRILHTPLQSMDDPVRLDRDEARLQDLWDDNTEQGTWLSAMIQNHYAYRRLHKQAWNKYGLIARECGRLEWEVDQEGERVEIVPQDQSSRAADSHLRCWGQE